MNATGAWGSGSGLSRLADRRGFRGVVAGVLTAVLTVAFLSAVSAPAAAAVSTATVDGYVYAYDSVNVAAGATVTDYVGVSTVVNIPGTVTIGALASTGTGMDLNKMLASFILLCVNGIVLVAFGRRRSGQRRV